MARFTVFLFLAFLLTSIAPLPAQVTFSGQINPLPPALKADLEAWQADHWQQIAEFPLTADGTYSVALFQPKAGQYRMRAWGQTDHWVDFLIPDSLPVALA
ncbi:MAG: hypothetical protein ABIO24_07955, partial [Saprospiraceae bacterium]